MTRQELIQELMQDSQTYCCYCGTPKVSFGCCGENHFETFAEMNKETQESILSDMASEVSDFWEGYVPEPVGAIGSSIKSESPLGCNGPTGPAQQEPVALETVYETIIRWDEGGGKRSRRELARRIVALYTRPQAREPLTDEEIDRLWSQSLADTEGETWLPLREFARAIEAAHGIGEKK